MSDCVKNDMRFGLATVRFLDNHSMPRMPDYRYIVTKGVFELVECYSSTGYPYVYNIENEHGYNYRDGRVVFIELEEISSSTEEKIAKYESELVKYDKLKTIVRATTTDTDQSLHANAHVKPTKIIRNCNKPLNDSLSDLSDSFKKITCQLSGEDLERLKSPVYGADYILGTSSTPYSNELLHNNKTIINPDKSLFLPADNCLFEMKIPDENNYKERGNNMFNFSKMFPNFKCGKVSNSEAVLTLYGPAFPSVEDQNASKIWIAYDAKTGEYIDASAFILENVDNMCYQLPISASEVKVNDYIRHGGQWVRVTDVTGEAGKIEVENPVKRTVETIFPAKNAFGFNFYTKLCSFGADMFAGSASESNPFGNLPFFAMLMSEGKSDMKEILPLMILSQNQGSGMDMTALMWLSVCSGNKSDMDSLFPLMMMANGTNPFSNLMKPQSAKENGEIEE